LERWIELQTYDEPWQWLVVGEDFRGYSFTHGQDIVWRHQQHGERLHSYCLNILAALPHIVGDKIIICEDDDWYSPDYVDVMDALLDQAPLVGNVPALFLNVRFRTLRAYANPSHASLGQTALRSEVVPVLAAIARRGSPSMDLMLWREWCGGTILYREVGFHVSCKGMPGTPGIASEHRAPRGQPDPEFRIARQLGLPEIYSAYSRASLLCRG
jgi:hypothetical protein